MGIELIPRHVGAVTPPTRGTAHACGYDLYAVESAVIHALDAGGSVRIPTGFDIHLPPGIGGLICSRSGLAAKGVFVTNAPGVIDPDYQGPLDVLLSNIGNVNFYVTPGMRIAQILFVPVLHPQWTLVDCFSSQTTRGTGGFGSTGI